MGSTINYPFNNNNINNEEIFLPKNENYLLIKKSHLSTSNYIYKKYFCEIKNNKYINKEKYTFIRCNLCLCYPFIRINAYISKVNIILKCNCGVKNISLNEIYEKYLSNPINSLSCSKHLNNEAEKYCLNCKIFLCKYCSLWHIKKYNKIHNIENIDSIFLICKKHNNNYFGFCNYCKVNICDCCKEHQNHTIVSFQRYQKLINIKEKIKKIFEYEKRIIREFYDEENYNSNNKEIEKLKEINIEILNLLKYFIYLYNFNQKNLNFQILYNIDMNSYFNTQNSLTNPNFITIANIPKSINLKPVNYYNNYDIENIFYIEKEREIISSKMIDFILLLQNGSLLLFSEDLITQYEDDTFTNKREIKLILESENKIRITQACEMNNNGKIIYLTGLKLVIFSLIDFSSQVFIRKTIMYNFKCLGNNNIIIRESDLSIIILKVNEKENNEETIQFNGNNIGRIISINTFSKCFIVETLKGIYNSYNNNNLSLINSLITNNSISSSMPAIKFDESKLITFFGDVNLHYFNIIEVKNLQFITKIYLNYNYFNRLNAFKLPDNNILILMNNLSFYIFDGINYNLLVKRNLYYSSYFVIITKNGKLICGKRPSELKIFQYSNLFFN